jgi:hypothetical protein
MRSYLDFRVSEETPKETGSRLTNIATSVKNTGCLTTDIREEAEFELIGQRDNLKSTLLKVTLLDYLLRY